METSTLAKDAGTVAAEGAVIAEPVDFQTEPGK